MEAEKIKKMFMKKRGMEDGDPMMDHKLKMLEDVSDEAGREMSDMEKMQQVTVASPDEEGLEQGLMKAKELVEGKEMMGDEMEYESVEEIDAKIAQLEEMKMQMMEDEDRDY